jgi:hypothetical protein
MGSRNITEYLEILKSMLIPTKDDEEYKEHISRASIA